MAGTCRPNRVHPASSVPRPVPRFLLLTVAFATVTGPPPRTEAVTLRVGPTRAYHTVRAAAQAVHDGDVVLIDAGVYRGDVASWRANGLTVRGVGGMARMIADGAQEGGKGIWVVYGRDFTAERIEFSGAAVPDRNGAGIRADISGRLSVRECSFHDNENGVLAGADEIVIERSRFDRNGAGDGKTHNLYIWGRSVTVRECDTRRARVGHNIKTRGQTNYILYNRILDQRDGTASYSIDVPDCGRTYLIGNVIEQGPASENHGIVSYGAESASHTAELYVVNNTFVNDNPDGGTFLHVRDGARALVVNNIFTGPGTPWEGGDVRARHNWTRGPFRGSPHFRAAGRYDYRLTSASPRAILDAGAAPGRSESGFDLTPRREFVAPASSRPRPRNGPIDLGAFEAPAAPAR